jgi:WD40 repeat protein/tRNA A-37 threonylcarbamoyl transferase component Bud32
MKNINEIRTAHSAPTKKSDVNQSSATGISVKKGDTLLELYKVEDGPIVGGMGRVFRVRHTGWNTLLAMKQPKQFLNEEQKQAFIHECNAWIKLDLHPHIVYCHYVREIDGIPSIFSEWMDGGSLKEAITSDALYKDGDKAALERILDISIQTARGLHYAHEQKLIHQDVKPENLLLSKTGAAKVADFGIANAKTIVRKAADRNTSPGTDLIIFGAGTYTLAYCSPEQKNEKRLTRRTDIWSWALSVLEMFTGKRQWSNGAEAGKAYRKHFDMERIPRPKTRKNLLRHYSHIWSWTLSVLEILTGKRTWGNRTKTDIVYENYLGMVRIQIPEAMKDLLWHCFCENEAERPHDFKEIEKTLLVIYKEETGKEYWRPLLKAATTADNLNNKALSYLDLGKPGEAEKYWKQALLIDPAHAESLYNQSVHFWRNGRIDGMKALYIVSSNHSEMTDCYLAKIHLSRGDAESALTYLNKAKDTSGETDDIRKMIAAAHQMIERGKDGRCIRTFEGHNEFINSVCFSPDGKTALSGSYDKTIKLWNVETGICIRTFEGHNKSIQSVCFSPDGKTVLSSSWDDTIKLWDAEIGICIQTFEGHISGIKSVCFSPDGKTVLSGKYDKTIKLWDVKTGICIRTFEGHNDYIWSVCFNPDGKTALSGSVDKTIKLWDVKTGICIRTFEGHNDYIWSVCFSPDGKTTLSGSRDKTIKLWDIVTGQCIRTFEGHNDYIQSVCFSPDGKTALSGSRDKTIKLWDIVTGQCIRTFEGHDDYIWSVCFSPDGKTALSGSYDKTLKLWSIPKPDYEMIISEVIPTGKTLYYAGRFDSLAIEARFFTLEGNISAALNTLREMSQIPLFGKSTAYYTIKKSVMRYCVCNKIIDQKKRIISQEAYSVCFNPDGKTALSGNYDKTIKLWDVMTGQCIQTFERHDESINSVCFSPDGKTTLLGSKDKTLKLWEVKTGQCIRTFERDDDYIRSICISPDGKTALSSYFFKTINIKIWNMETGECIRTFEKGRRYGINSVCFSPDGMTVLSGDRDETIKLWDVMTGQCFRTFGGHIFGTNTVCFSPDGKTALSGGNDNTIRLWEVKTGKCVRSFKIHKHQIYSVCFSPDGKTVLSGSSDRTIKLWNVKTGQCLHTFEGHSSYINSVCFSPDGTSIISGGKHEIIIHDLDYELSFPGWTDWDEGARPYVDIFLTLHPDWTDKDFDNILIPELQRRGYGWLRPEGVRVKLEEIK